MFEIFSQTDNKTICASPDSTILEATLKGKINHIHVCGGNARCTTCRVYIMDGLSNCRPRNEKEKHLVEKLGFPQNIRLACQTKISGNITIRRLVVDNLDIKIILKQHQRSGKLTEGIVKNILTNSSTHPHGIKVRLTDGKIGRVQSIMK